MSSDGTGRATQASIGGASGDAGVEYRRAVAAYAVACGLAGVPLHGFGAPANASVKAVALETDDPIDDISITFTSGWKSLVQAKRSLAKGKAFDSAVRQWVTAIKSGIDLERIRLVIVTGHLSHAMRALQDVLDRHKTEAPGQLTTREATALAHLDSRLTELNDEQRRAVLRCASIHKLEVEEEHFAKAREGALLLGRVVAPSSEGPAWSSLVAIAGLAARRRGGFTLSGWLTELRRVGVIIEPEGQSVSAELERRHRAVDRYLSALRRRARHVDLRSLGATMPPLLWTELDGDVRALRDPDDSRSDGELVWAFLRRGRTVLTGLPGSGKSAALRALAAELAIVRPEVLPILVSLKDVDKHDEVLGFRDRILAIGLRDVPQADRTLMREEFEERLTTGSAVVLLDSLDETYERRGAVVAAIEEFLADASPDVDVLLATRDVAYGQAATLRWPTLRLTEPRNWAKTIEAVLRSIANHRALQSSSVGRDTIDDWIALRLAWIKGTLDRDVTLRETPLLPILLALLAADRDPGVLPTSRAQILKAVIRDIVSRREADRRTPLVIGAIQGERAASAAIDAFGVEASVILANGGQCQLVKLTSVLATALEKRWDLSSGDAEVAALAAARFWDEAGIFVISGGAEMVAPRVMLFAEIGDALHAVSRSDDSLSRWIEESIAARKLEPLVLAAGLSTSAAMALAAAAVRSADRELLHGVLQAMREGAELQPESLQGVTAAVLKDVERGDRESWASWTSLMGLRERSLSLDVMRHALDVFPAQQRAVGDALVDLRSKTAAELREKPKLLLEVLGIEWLQALPSREQHKDWKTSISVDRVFVDAVYGAADALLGSVPAALDPVVKQLSTSPGILHDQLLRLLRARGFKREADAAMAEHNARLFETMTRFLDVDRDAHVDFLRLLSDAPQVGLEFQQRARLDELADFVETLNRNDVSAWVGRDLNEHMPAVVALISTLGSFDRAVIASEAAVVLERIALSGDRSAAFFALFDRATTRDLPNWDSVLDKPAAVRLLIQMFTWGRGNALVAAHALWAVDSVADLAAPLLRDLLPHLQTSPEHQRIAATVLCSLNTGPEPDCWVADENPVLRAVVARWCGAVEDGHVSPTIRRLLRDEDGHVRSAALRTVSSADAEDRSEVLAQLSTEPDPGWMCLHCRTQNESGRRSCKKEDCFSAAPHPARDAVAILEGTYKDD